MKKLYLFATISLIAFIFSSCSKDVLKPYDDRIEGNWTLTDVDKIGFGSSHLDYTEGYFYFDPSGRFEYTDRFGNLYEGSWDIRKDWIRGNCYIDDNGNSNCDDRYVKNLRIEATDFNTRDSKFEFFDEMRFTSTNRFKAYIYDGTRTYVFRFKRD